MQNAKHSPSPWNNGRDANGNLIVFQDERITGENRNEEYQANRRLADAAPDRHEQVIVLTLLGWEVARVNLYDEEGIEGWRWTEPNGTEHIAIGDWNEPPPWPDSARAAAATETGTTK